MSEGVSVEWVATKCGEGVEEGEEWGGSRVLMEEGLEVDEKRKEGRSEM